MVARTKADEMGLMRAVLRIRHTGAELAILSVGQVIQAGQQRLEVVTLEG